MASLTLSNVLSQKRLGDILPPTMGSVPVSIFDQHLPLVLLFCLRTLVATVLVLLLVTVPCASYFDWLL